MYRLLITTAIVFFSLLLSYYGKISCRAKSASAGQKLLTPPSESMLVKPLRVSSVKSFKCAIFVDWTPALESSQLRAWLLYTNHSKDKLLLQLYVFP